MDQSENLILIEYLELTLHKYNYIHTYNQLYYNQYSKDITVQYLLMDKLEQENHLL